MIQCWLEVLVVSLPALLRGARTDELGYSDPIQGSLGVNKAFEISILCLRPRSSSVRHTISAIMTWKRYMGYGWSRTSVHELIRFMTARDRFWKRDLVVILRLSHTVGNSVQYGRFGL